MSELQLWAASPSGPVRMSAPPGAQDLHDLFDGLPTGVYSGLRTYEHDRFLRLEHHLARTERSAALLGWTGPLDSGLVRRSLHQLVSSYPAANARVRFDWLPEPLGSAAGSSRLLMGLGPFTPVPTQALERGVRLALTRLRRPSPDIKAAEFVRERRVCASTDPTAYEHLMVDSHGRILEGTSSNFFGVRQGVLITAGTGVLDGVTRRIVLELAEALGLGLSLGGVVVEDLPRLDEAFLSSSTREIVPVVQVAAVAIGNGRPGAATAELRQAFSEFARRYARPAWPGEPAQPRQPAAPALI